MSAGFDELSPALQYQVVNELGFDALRPVQELAIGPLVAGHNAVILAPTAGGKTEAAFFPLLSEMDRHDWRAVSCLYISPIRALLNAQEARLSRLSGLIGRRAALWHGDTPTRERRAIGAEPPDVLLTTPESLEVMLISPRVAARRLFAGLQAVVIDEVHAFVGDDRGGHLAAVLERLSRLAGRDVQRVGLSATVGNPKDILAWLAGSSARPGALVDPPRPPSDAAVHLDCVGTLDNAAVLIERLHPGRKRLVFADSRRQVEALGRALAGRGVDVHVMHSSLSAEARADAEARFSDGSDCVIVATSSLELGIDIGDLDHVLQIDAPGTVASFLQRMGRTGRRPGTTANCTFLATEPWRLLQAAALLDLYATGYVEPVLPVAAAAHLLAHQVIALSLQEGGIGRTDWPAWIDGAAPFADLDPDDRAALLDHMLSAGILHQDAGRLGLGPQGERLYGRMNFRELYAVFSTPPLLQVLFGSKEIGSLDAGFAGNQRLDELVFTLGARAWRAKYVEWSKGVLHAEPAEHGRAPTWRGAPLALSPELCGAMRDRLSHDDDDPRWSRRAATQLAALRQDFAFLAPKSTTLVAGQEPVWWTFAGLRANQLLAALLGEALGDRVTADNFALRFRDGAAESPAAITAALTEFAGARRPTDDDAETHAGGCARSRLSKFQPCLPPALEARYLASQLTDTETARAIVEIPATVVGAVTEAR